MDRIVMYEDHCPTSRTICVDFELPNETLRYWWYQGIYIYISHRFGPYTKLLKNLSKWKVVPVPIHAYVCCQNWPIEILFYSNLQLGLGVGHIILPPIMGCSENLGKSGTFFPCPNKSINESQPVMPPRHPAESGRVSTESGRLQFGGRAVPASGSATTDGLKETMTWMG